MDSLNVPIKDIIPESPPEPLWLSIDLCPLEHLVDPVPEHDPNPVVIDLDLADFIPESPPEPLSFSIDLCLLEHLVDPVPEHDPNSMAIDLDPINKDLIPEAPPEPLSVSIDLCPLDHLVDPVPEHDPNPKVIDLDLPDSPSQGIPLPTSPTGSQNAPVLQQHDQDLLLDQVPEYTLHQPTSAVGETTAMSSRPSLTASPTKQGPIVLPSFPHSLQQTESLFSKPHGYRKLVDLVYMESHGLFLNLEPKVPIQVGLYGRVNPDTGRFEVEGNIYEDRRTTEEYGIAQPATTHAPDEKVTVSSSSGIRTDFVESAEEGAPPPILRYEVVFASGRSVVLALIRPQIRALPKPSRLAKLAARPELCGQAVIDRIFVCPAYALVITGPDGGKVSTCFENTAEGGKWTVSTTSGYERTAIGRRPEYYVLYSLKHITADGLRDRRRWGGISTPGPEYLPIEAKNIKDDEELPPYDVPWGELDEDGDEAYVDELDEHALAEIEAFGR